MSHDVPKKKLSGYQNLINKRKREEERDKNVTRITQFFSTPASTSKATPEPEQEPCTSSKETEAAESITDDFHPKKVMPSISITNTTDDPGLWPNNLSTADRQVLIENIPKQVVNYNFPRDSSSRKFSSTYYERHLKNGEKYVRNWLLYSISKNAVFCFCCKLFDTQQNNAFCRGVNDWLHLAMYLNRHEKCSSHFANYKKWIDLSHAFKTKTTIDSAQQKLFDIEKQRWYDVIKRIIYVVQFLCRQNLAFRGQESKLYVNNNGNFLKCIEMISKFDPVMAEHIRRVTSDSHYKNMPSYLGDKIQNEIISILGTELQNSILSLCKQNKYFSIILDCTPDISHVEQISVSIRFVHFNVISKLLEIREHFLVFCPIFDTTGAGLSSFVLEQLQQMDLDVNNIRGQGYDNGSNMRGKNCGLQKILLDINPRAFYIPCSNHSLNLVINDMASINHETIGFFNLIQELYKYFSASTKRWNIVKDHFSNITLKPLSDTRWSSRIDAIKPLYKNLPEIYDALYDISNSDQFDEQSKYQAKCLGEKISSFAFICSVYIWYEILTKVNFVNKILQSTNVNVQIALENLQELKQFLHDLRTDVKFDEFINKAKEMGEKLGVEPNFQKSAPLRRRRKTKQFNYEHDDQPILDPIISFKVNFFYCVLDQALISVQERFSLLENHIVPFKFLYNLSEPQEKNNLIMSCKNLQEKLHANNDFDVEADDLCEEIMQCHPSLNKLESDVFKILNYIFVNNLTAVYPNLTVALRILLTLPISVATAERSFSKLKIIKNYLRSTMSQTRLSNLSIISIEAETLDEVDIHEMIKKFAHLKARKIDFV